MADSASAAATPEEAWSKRSALREPSSGLTSPGPARVDIVVTLPDGSKTTAFAGHIVERVFDGALGLQSETPSISLAPESERVVRIERRIQWRAIFGPDEKVTIYDRQYRWHDGGTATFAQMELYLESFSPRSIQYGRREERKVFVGEWEEAK